jgi:hypothetical protein
MRRELAMTIENERNSLTQSEQNILTEDRERWQRMGAGAHLDDWLAYGPGLMLRRRMAMRIAYVNRPEGKGYIQAFAALMQGDGLDTMDKTSVSAVLWLHDDSERLQVLRELRDGMKPGERARLNSPITARQRVKKTLKAREGWEPAPRTTSLSRLATVNAELRRENEHLREQLAAAE